MSKLIEQFTDSPSLAFRRHTLRYVILQTLQDEPTHLYELMKKLSNEFGGLYRPSAGAIYPAIQALEDEGYVRAEEREVKKIYTVTTKGREFLQKRADMTTEVIHQRQTFLRERRGLNRELRNFLSLIMTNYFDLETEKTDAIEQVFKEA